MSSIDHLNHGKIIIKTKFLYKFVNMQQSLMARFIIAYYMDEAHKEKLNQNESTMIYTENGNAERVRREKDKAAKGMREVLHLGHKSEPLAKCGLRLDQQFV